MRSGIEQARLELTKWEARVADDKAALATAEAQASYIRDRLAGAERCAKGLRDAVSLWDAMHTKGET